MSRPNALGGRLAALFVVAAIDRSRERELDRNAMARARRLVAKHPAIKIERDGPGGHWVTCGGLTESDGNFCEGGREVLERVEHYVAKLEGGA